MLLLAVVVFCSGCGKKEDEPVSSLLNDITKRGQLVVGVKTDTYPFGFMDEDGNFAGYDVDLAKLIAKGILGDSTRVKFVPVSASDRVMKLYSADVDMLIATMSITPKREEILDFSNSYYTAGQSLLVNRGSKVKGIRDLSGKRAIIVFGSTAENSIRGAVPNVNIVGYKTYPQAFNALKAGKADAIIADDTILLDYSLRDKDVVLLHKKYSKEPYAVAFRKEDSSKSLIRAVNSVIEIETKNGHLKKLRKTYGIK